MNLWKKKWYILIKESGMYLVVGLGNPGRQYEATRHNMGFDVIDRLVEEHRIPLSLIHISEPTRRS